MEQERRSDKSAEYACVFEDNTEIDVVFADDIVNGVADNDGREQGCGNLNHREDERTDDIGKIGTREFEQFLDCARFHFSCLSFCGGFFHLISSSLF